jgi:hypothetical protein
VKIKNNTGNKLRVLVFITALTAVLGFTTLTNAALVTYQFSGTITGVYPSEPGFPSILQAVQVGNTFTGSYSYDSATPPSPSPYGGLPYASGTHYQVPNTLSLTINNISIPIWGNTLDVFVWNNVSLFPSYPNHDGYYVTQSRTLSDPYFIDLGNWLLPSSTFSDGSLPVTSITPGVFNFYGQPGNISYLDGSMGTIVATNPVPIPPAIWIFGPGLLGLLGMRKKLSK